MAIGGATPISATAPSGGAIEVPNYDLEAANKERQTAINNQLISAVELALVGVMFSQLSQTRKVVGEIKSDGERRLSDTKELDSELED